jgi:hypothetical protein
MHQRTYPDFREWSNGVHDYALTQGRLRTVFDQRIHTPPLFLIAASYLVMPQLKRLMMLAMLPVSLRNAVTEKLREPREVGQDRISEFC